MRTKSWTVRTLGNTEIATRKGGDFVFYLGAAALRRRAYVTWMPRGALGIFLVFELLAANVVQLLYPVKYLQKQIRRSLFHRVTLPRRVVWLPAP